MRFQDFQDPKKFYSVVLFIQDSDVETLRVELEAIGKQANVRMIIQPCPYEGIEFLCRVSGQIVGHKVSVDKDLFWQAMELKRNTPADVVTKIVNHQHEYLCAILEQDATKVEQEGRVLQSSNDFYY